MPTSSCRPARRGEPIRESAWPMTVDGNGHTLRQTCFEKRLLRQDGTGFLLLEDIALTRGGNDGPGAAVTTRGEIEIRDSHVTTEPVRGTGRRDLLDAQGDDRPLGDHRKSRQRRRRWRVRAPRRRRGLRLDRQRQSRRRLRRGDRVDRRHPGRQLSRRRQHHRRRRRRALHRRGRRRHGRSTRPSTATPRTARAGRSSRWRAT